MSGPSVRSSGSDTPIPKPPITATGGHCRPAGEQRSKVANNGEVETDTLDTVNAKLRKNLEKLTHTYKELEEVVSATESAQILLDGALKLRYFTSSCKQLFDISESDQGQPVAILAEKLNCHDLERHTKEVLEQVTTLKIEVLAANGRWYLVALRPDLVGTDAANGVVLDFIDVTQRKEAELSTERARRYAEKILETLQEPIIVLTADLRIQSANPAFYRIFQHREKAVVGKSIFVIGDGQWDCPKFRELLERVLPNNERFEGFELNHDFAVIGKRTLLLNFQRLDEEQLILLAVHDITSDRQVDSLRFRENSLVGEVEVRRRLQEMASAVLQSDNMQEVFNHVLHAGAQLLKTDMGSLQIINGDGELELVAHQGIDADVLCALKVVKAGDNTACSRALRHRRRVVVENVSADESYKPHSKSTASGAFRAVQSTPLIGREGKLLGVFSTYYHEPRKLSAYEEYALDLLTRETADLCEWLKTEKQLRQSETRLRAQSEQLLANDRQKNQFLGLLGHELRNPLTVMRNSIQTLVAEEHAFAMNSRVSEALALLERQSRHMTHLVNDLLDITRINNGKVVLRRERVSLPRCLDEVLAAHRSTLVGRKLGFSIDKSESPVYLDADAARLFQVLDNLLTNAIKFTQPGGSIQVSIGKLAREAVISIKDNGIGIPPESIGSLFHPFTQVDNNLALHGLGLGLSLVKSLVELHGGDIVVHSDGEDQGSEFVVRWPLHKRQAESAADAAPPVLRVSATTHPRRILVVDDIADIANSFARLLEAAGHEVYVAYDGEQGLVMAKQNRPSVAFLDLVMPDMDGLELAQRLRREFDPQDLTLVVVSGYGQSQDIEKAHAAGFEYHLLKPIEVQQVYTLLDSLTGEADRDKHA
ncbi:MAG: ATP-binding protein [Cellvibrionaceae bacterium]